jgi:hypothetical protein
MAFESPDEATSSSSAHATALFRLLGFLQRLLQSETVRGRGTLGHGELDGLQISCEGLLKASKSLM